MLYPYLQAENYGFASFESVPYAHIVAKKLTGRTKNGSTLNLAPTPHDIIWEVSPRRSEND